MSQIELFEQATQLKTITDQGYQIFYLTVSDMKEFILKQCEKSGLWLYIDGVSKDPIKVDTDILSSAKEIILTQPLVGG